MQLPLQLLRDADSDDECAIDVALISMIGYCVVFVMVAAAAMAAAVDVDCALVVVACAVMTYVDLVTKAMVENQWETV